LELLLVRHGQTAWNVGEVFRGRADIELNETGRRQAQLLGEFLRVPAIEAVYSSPLKRALDTARAVAAHHNLEVRISEGLKDMSFGEWEGVQAEVVKQRYPEAYAAWSLTPERALIPGGETLAAVKQRAVATVNAAVSMHTGRVVFVTHRVITKITTLALLGLDETRFWNIVIDTCGVTTFRIQDGRNILVRHNDSSFLRGSGENLVDF
jgi:broad specificity phosphatase PhoE